MKRKTIKIREADIKTRTARTIEASDNLKDACAEGHPAFVPQGGGYSLGYTRSLDGQTAGSWCARWGKGAGKSKRKTFALADDYEDSNGTTVLSYAEAFAKVRQVAEAEGRLELLEVKGKTTVAMMLDAYEKRLAQRRQSTTNATRVRYRLEGFRDGALLAMAIEDTTKADWLAFQDYLRDDCGIVGATVNRIMKNLHAGLVIAAEADKRITNHKEWSLTCVPTADSNVHHFTFKKDNNEPQEIVAAAYRISLRFGLWVEAHTYGMRSSQYAACSVGDLKVLKGKPILVVMQSNKGKGKNGQPKVRKPIAVRIHPEFAARLRQATAGRRSHEPLFLNDEATPTRWSANQDAHKDQFRAIMVELGFEQAMTPEEALADNADASVRTPTIYAFRHTAIIEQLLAGRSGIVVGKRYDTSERMINEHYGLYVDVDAGDEILENTVNVGSLAIADNVVPMVRA